MAVARVPEWVRHGVPPALGSDSACGAGAGPTGLPVLTEIGCGGSAWITGLRLIRENLLDGLHQALAPTPYSRGMLRFVREKTRPCFANLAPEVRLNRLRRLRLRSRSRTGPVLRACQAAPSRNRLGHRSSACEGLKSDNLPEKGTRLCP